MKKNILDLVLIGHWFDMIETGGKREEYREIKPYWEKRLLNYKAIKEDLKSLAIRKIVFGTNINACVEYNRHFDIVRFRRGYTNRTIDYAVDGIRFGRGRPEWGAPTDRDVFIISFHEIKEYINPHGRRIEQSVEDYESGKFDNCYAAPDMTHYKKVAEPEKWECCPVCGLRPKIWEFDNMRATMCACVDKKDPSNQYRHFAIYAESIMSVCSRSDNGQNATEYDCDGLRKNWNEWAKTWNIVFDRDTEYKQNHKW